MGLKTARHFTLSLSLSLEIFPFPSTAREMGCGESKHAVATENIISKSKSEKSNSKRIAESFVEEKEKLIKEPVVDGNVEERGSLEEGKENAKVADNGNGESKVEENVKEMENSEKGKETAKVKEEKEGGNAKETDNGNGKSKVEENVKIMENSEVEEKKGEGNAKETDNGNGKSEGEENVKGKEENLEASVMVVEENKEGKSDEISVHQEVVAAVQEPDVEKLKRENESIIPEENASEGKMDLNDNVEGKEIIKEAKEESNTEESIKVENAEEVKEEVVLPIAETEDSATKKE